MAATSWGNIFFLLSSLFLARAQVPECGVWSQTCVHINITNEYVSNIFPLSGISDGAYVFGQDTYNDRDCLDLKLSVLHRGTWTDLGPGSEDVCIKWDK